MEILALIAAVWIVGGLFVAAFKPFTPTYATDIVLWPAALIIWGLIQWGE